MTGGPSGSWQHVPTRSAARVYARSIGAILAIQDACTSGEIAGLAPLLHEDAHLIVDTGGRVAAPESACGRTHALHALALILDARGVATTTVHSINGSAGLALRDAGDRVIGIVSVAVHRRIVHRIWVVLNPDKLRHWN
ncbi:hypothetical protein [Leifsonia sp. Le1]|uniref:hypothetical protein n=1 Tax=Leifsonia sp. Le1 TaxID=3404918 RepID=UPI003EB8BAE4